MVARPAWRLSPWNKKLAAALIGATRGVLAAVSHCQTLPVAGNLGGGSGGGGRPASPPPEDCSDTEMHSSVITFIAITFQTSYIISNEQGLLSLSKNSQCCQLGIRAVLYRIVLSVSHNQTYYRLNLVHSSDDSFKLGYVS